MFDTQNYKKIVTVFCYIQKENKILMLKKKGFYNAIGGKVEKGESPYEAIKRETLEEAGIRIEPIYKGHISIENFTKNQDWDCHVFFANSYSGNLLKESPEGELSWINKENLLKINIWESDKQFIPLVFENKFFFMNMKFENQKYKSNKVWFLEK